MKKIGILFVLVLALPAFAFVPRQISVQGILLDNGQPANGSFVLKLNLYDAPTGGTLLYSDIESVTISNGIYNVFLGNQIALPDSLTFDRPYYLGVSVNNGAELSLRSLLTPVANAFYAVRAGTSDSARIAGTALPIGVATGDLSGAYPSPVVAAIQSHPVSSATPTVGQTLAWDGTQWSPSSGSAVAFCVIGGTFQTLPHNANTPIDFTQDNGGGAFNDGHYFSLDSDWFTAPTDGYYYLDAFLTVQTSAAPTDFYLYFAVNGSELSYRRYYNVPANAYPQYDYTIPIKLNAGDHVRVVCEPYTNSVMTMGGNADGVVQFSGFRIN